MWGRVRDRLCAEIEGIRVGDVADFRNFMGAVIDRRAFTSITGYIRAASEVPGAKIVAGGKFNDEEGYFIRPTLVEAADPRHKLMAEEIFGPVVTLHPYDSYDEVLRLVDSTSPYALTGAVFARDRRAVVRAMTELRNAAGNFYVNDKPTGAVVGQQPFGGARASGTNDKAGSALNLMRWTSVRAIKENFPPAQGLPLRLLTRRVVVPHTGNRESSRRSPKSPILQVLPASPGALGQRRRNDKSLNACASCAKIKIGTFCRALAYITGVDPAAVRRPQSNSFPPGLRGTGEVLAISREQSVTAPKQNVAVVDTTGSFRPVGRAARTGRVLVVALLASGLVAETVQAQPQPASRGEQKPVGTAVASRPVTPAAQRPAQVQPLLIAMMPFDGKDTPTPPRRPLQPVTTAVAVADTLVARPQSRYYKVLGADLWSGMARLKHHGRATDIRPIARLVKANIIIGGWLEATPSKDAPKPYRLTVTLYDDQGQLLGQLGYDVDKSTLNPAEAGRPGDGAVPDDRSGAEDSGGYTRGAGGGQPDPLYAVDVQPGPAGRRGPVERQPTGCQPAEQLAARQPAAGDARPRGPGRPARRQGSGAAWTGRPVHPQYQGSARALRSPAALAARLRSARRLPVQHPDVYQPR